MMKSNQAELAVASTLQRQFCNGSDLMRLGERHKAGEVYLLGMTTDVRDAKGKRWLYEVSYRIENAAATEMFASEPESVQPDFYE